MKVPYGTFCIGEYMGKKAKTHMRVNGRLLQMNKSFKNLKMKQRDKITAWVYEEYKAYVTKYDCIPDEDGDMFIVENVLAKIYAANIWIPDGEIVDYYNRKKNHLAKRYQNEMKMRYKSYVDFYKCMFDQESAMIICDLDHEIIDINQAAIKEYEQYGGEKLIGKCYLDCYDDESKDKIIEVVQWFKISMNHNLIYMYHHDDKNEDVYLKALRHDGKLIGYCEKHENRNREMIKEFDTYI